MKLLGYRKVPTLNDTLGDGSLSVEPYVEQLFIKQPELIEDDLALNVNCLSSTGSQQTDSRHQGCQRPFLFFIPIVPHDFLQRTADDQSAEILFP